MVTYTCDKCNEKFDHKIAYNRHKNRKTDCSKYRSKSIKEPTDHRCDNCDKIYSRKDSLARHKSVCKGKVSQSNTKNSAVIIGNENNTFIKSPVTINLIVFGKDGIEHISQKDLCEILKSNKNLYESLITNTNLNPKKPQHHNIFYGDMKSSYGEVYENDKWVKKKISEILNTLLDTKQEDLTEILNDMGDFLNEKTRDKISNAIKDVDYSNPGSRKRLITYLKALLYNHKDMIIKTKEQEEEIFRKEQEEAEAEEEELNRQTRKIIKNTAQKKKQCKKNYDSEEDVSDDINDDSG